MKRTDDVDVSVAPDQVRVTVVAIEQDPNFTVRLSPISMTYFGKLAQNLRALEDARNNPPRGVGIIFSDEIENVPEPALSFLGPPYFCHVPMRRSTSSLETRLPFRISSIPRSIMRSKTNSRTISS